MPINSAVIPEERAEAESEGAQAKTRVCDRLISLNSACTDKAHIIPRRQWTAMPDTLEAASVDALRAPWSNISDMCRYGGRFVGRHKHPVSTWNGPECSVPKY